MQGPKRFSIRSNHDDSRPLANLGRPKNVMCITKTETGMAKKYRSNDRDTDNMSNKLILIDIDNSFRLEEWLCPIFLPQGIIEKDTNPPMGMDARIRWPHYRRKGRFMVEYLPCLDKIPRSQEIVLKL